MVPVSDREQKDRTMRFKEMIRWSSESGDRVLLGDVAVTPRSQALVIRIGRVAWVWNRPKDIVIEREGRSERIPIADVTRRAQLVLIAMKLALVIFFFRAKSRTNRRSE